MSWIALPRFLTATSRRKILGTFSGVAAFGALTVQLCSGNVVLCKVARSTPDYLLPHYLRNSRTRFYHYASIVEGDERYMTPDDFVRAILATKDKGTDASSHNSQAVKDLRALFLITDANNDGRLSLHEFSLLLVLLATPKKDWSVAFGMYDKAQQGGLSFEEFKEVVQVFGDPEAVPKEKEGIARRLFGADGSRRCGWATFERLLSELKMEVAKAEFRQYDPEGVGSIPVEAFAKLVLSPPEGYHMPFYLVDNMRRLAKRDAACARMPFSSWVHISSVIDKSSELGEALRIYSASGRPVLPKDLARACETIGLPPLVKQEVDVLFGLFDRNGDGQLDYDEFICALDQRAKLHAKTAAEKNAQEKVTKIARLFRCLTTNEASW